MLNKNKAELDRWYAEVPWRPGFIEKGSSPKVTANSVWTVVTEVFDRKNRIPTEEWNAIQKASRFLGKMLHNGENDRWAPERDGEQSICLELAFNAAVTRRVLSDTCVPSDVYTCLKLQVKDKDRGRFHLLLRDASSEELGNPTARKYMINTGPLAGKMMRRIRTVQGHSGVMKELIKRVNQQEVEKNNYPVLLMHSTQVALLGSIGVRGLIPGGLTRGRVDVLMRNAVEFAYHLYFPDKMFAPKLEWQDPVSTDHMRKESDVVVFVPGSSLAELKDFKLYFSSDTGDYLAPYVIPASCLVSARRRLDGFNELETPEVLEGRGSPTTLQSTGSQQDKR